MSWVEALWTGLKLYFSAEVSAMIVLAIAVTFVVLRWAGKRYKEFSEKQTEIDTEMKGTNDRLDDVKAELQGLRRDTKNELGRAQRAVAWCQGVIQAKHGLQYHDPNPDSALPDIEEEVAER